METILCFLRELSENNNREWFEENKKRYLQSLEIFRSFVARVIAGIAVFDPAMKWVEPKDSIFRIYKDVRFSRDKTPYKTNFGSWMARGGRQSNDAGYYFHLQPGASFMAAGVYMPPKEQLHLIRQEIVFNPEAFREVFHDPWINKHYQRSGDQDKLKKGPADFPGDTEMIEEIKYKHYIFSKSYSDQEIVSKDFPQRLVEDYRGLFPVVHYLNNALSYQGNE
ncbi:MAG: DUF2461 domain-containing protein [Bacteroidales bacterium]